MASEYTKVLQFNQYQKSDKTFIISAVLECLIKRLVDVKIILENNLQQEYLYFQISFYVIQVWF